MYTLILLLCGVGFFCLYNTSRKARLSKRGKWEKWLQAQPAMAKLVGSSLILLTMALLIFLDGLAMGLYNWFLMLMTMASIIVAIAPFFYLKFKHTISLFFLAFMLEMIIF